MLLEVALAEPALVEWNVGALITTTHLATILIHSFLSFLALDFGMPILVFRIPVFNFCLSRRLVVSLLLHLLFGALPFHFLCHDVICADQEKCYEQYVQQTFHLIVKFIREFVHNYFATGFLFHSPIG